MQQWEQGSMQEMTAESEPHWQAWRHREDNHAVLGCATMPIFGMTSRVYYSSRPTLSDRAVLAGVLSPSHACGAHAWIPTIVGPVRALTGLRICTALALCHVWMPTIVDLTCALTSF